MIKLENISKGLWFRDKRSDVVGSISDINFSSPQPSVIFDQGNISLVEDLEGIEMSEEFLVFSKFEPKYSPITHDLEFCGWLKKFHIVVTNWGDWTNYPGRPWCIHIDNSDFESIGSGMFKDVHEFQTLVRGITGESIEFDGLKEFMRRITGRGKIMDLAGIGDRDLDIGSVMRFINTYTPRMSEYFKAHAKIGNKDDLFQAFGRYLEERLYGWKMFDKTPTDYTELINRDFTLFLSSYHVCSE